MRDVITSSANPQVRNVIALGKKPRERNAQGLFLVEGSKMCLEAPAGQVAQVFVSESFLQSGAYRENGERFAALAERTVIVSDRVFASMSDTQTPQGVLCLVRQLHYEKADILRSHIPGGHLPLVMVLEDVRDPGNLGTLVRTGEGAGVTGFFMSPGCVDIYNPKVIRSTMGSIYRVPFLYAVDEADFYGTIRGWKENEESGLRFYAAHLQGRSAYDREDYRSPSAFLIGNESRGLTDTAAALADTLIRIPMLGQVESLNAAMAGGILMYEAARQRRAAGFEARGDHPLL